ncbi:MAG: DUF6547 family protein [Prosthecobacter sp.]
MSDPRKPQIYRNVIDDLVKACREDQGQIGPRRVRAGVWNPNAKAGFIPAQHEINLLLQRLSAGEREILAGMLEESVQTGVFETLKVLEEHQIEPFLEGHEGSPYHDFVGRMNDWEWPEEQVMHESFCQDRFAVLALAGVSTRKAHVAAASWSAPALRRFREP